MLEIYKDLIGYGNRYEVSNLGNVRIKESKRVLKQFTVRKYKYVGLYYDGKSHSTRVHRLVAKTFLKDYSEECLVMHLDNNPANNNVDNLKCGTQSENMQQCVRDNRFYRPVKKVKQYDLRGNFIKEWNSQTDIQNELGYRQNFISMCCNGDKPTAYGYKWELSKE